MDRKKEAKRDTAKELVRDQVRKALKNDDYKSRTELYRELESRNLKDWDLLSALEARSAIDDILGRSTHSDYTHFDFDSEFVETSTEAEEA